jgi:hypothetical protein
MSAKQYIIVSCPEIFILLEEPEPFTVTTDDVGFTLFVGYSFVLPLSCFVEVKFKYNHSESLPIRGE